MELTSPPREEWEEPTIPKGRSTAHEIIAGKKAVFILFDIETSGEYCGILHMSAETFWIELVSGGRKKYKRHSNQHRERGQHIQQICESRHWVF